MNRLRSTGLCLAALAIGAGMPACSTGLRAAPTCASSRRVAIVAQAVPTASYVPCIDRLAEGWTIRAFDVARGHARLTLGSDRAEGRSVTVELRPTCTSTGAAPSAPRADGVRTAIRLTSISPRYAGSLYDVFAGGCITYRFDFPRGPHIRLMEDLQTTVGLMTRRELRLQLEHDLDVDLGS